MKTETGIILPGTQETTIITPQKPEIIVPKGTISADDGHLINIDLVQGGALGTETLDCLKSPTDTQMSEAGFANPRQLNELKDIFVDLLSGDPAASHDNRFSYLNFKQIKLALEWLMTNNFDERLQSLLLERPYLLTFKNKPPTPEEFLTHKYIGSMADSLWLPLRKAFVEYFDPMKPYRTAALNPSVGVGKSTFTQMALLFVAASFALMRDPWKFFNKSKTTIFAITLCAVTLTKAKEIYEEPIRQLIESADFWHYCRTHKDMLDEEKHLAESDEVEYIPWGHAAQVGVFKTGNNMTWKVISNANALLGVNILMGAMTEITFFKEAGKGWALKYDTPILMRDGTIKPLFEIKVGDYIAHPNNEKNVVKKIPFDEIDDDYEITLDDGRQVIANYHHIWKVSFRKDSSGNKVWDLAETGFILENIDKYKFEIPEVSLPITTMDVMNNI